MSSFWMSILKPRAYWAKWLVFLIMATVLALGAMGHLEFLKQYADTEELSFNLGDYRISAYKALKVVLTVVFIFWVAAIVSGIAESRIGNFTKIRASNRAIILKFVQIVIYIVSFLFALDFLGINLTTLTIFSGALGIGLGFGLQKIASNFVSGIILLLEKSVEEDDLVEMSDGTAGFVRKAYARFTLVETFDGKEMMIPNEDFITNRLTNWTFSNPRGRIEIPIGVAYGSDIEKAQELILEAACAHPRCISDPAPKCFLRNFGDSSVDFILHFWVEDVTVGRWEPQSQVMFEIWRKFKECGIEIPFPQRDLHLKNPETIKVTSDG